MRSRAVVCALLALLGLQLPVIGDASARNHAVLVGVTSYPNLKGKQLKAPGNDVRRIWKMLRAENRFKPQDIVVLTDDAQAFQEPAVQPRHPTRANILKALDDLARDVAPGDFVVFYFSGHGAFVPQGATDVAKRETEQDGYDEVLLAVDVARFDGARKTTPGVIVDDELKVKFDAIRQKATLWAIIDSCHAGGTMRSAGDPGKFRYKQIDLSELGIDPKEFRVDPPAGSQDRAASLVDSLGKYAEEGRSEWIQHAKDAKPIIAFLAVSEDRPAIERDMKVDGEPGESFSIFTDVLVKSMARQSWGSYLELANIVHAEVAAASGREQLPVFEGALTERIFASENSGLPRWPAVLIGPGRLHIKGGRLASLAPGTIVSLRHDDKLVGYARVAEVHLADSFATPIERGGVPVPPEDALKDRTLYVEIVDSVVDTTIKVARPAAADCDPDQRGRPVGPALARLGKAIDALARLDPKAFPVRWVGAGEAGADIRLCIAGDVVYFLPGDAPARLSAAAARRQLSGFEVRNDDMALLETQLRTELWKVLRYRNLLRIAADGGSSEIASQVEIELRRMPQVSVPNAREEQPCRDADRSKLDVIRPGDGASKVMLTHCDRVVVRIRNGWRKAVDVTLLYLDAEKGIIGFDAGLNVRLEPGGGVGRDYPAIEIITWCNQVRKDGNGMDWEKCEKMRRDGKAAFAPVGTEHLVVILAEAESAPRNFYYLTQPALERAPEALLGTKAAQQRRFRSQMSARLAERGATRSLQADGRPVDGAVRMFTWEVVPPAQRR